ncbi:MAG: hypothetical protein HXY22_04705 [Alphaproteobacteria bacterium]|nr:hypothetical protein [Alphaproteobacteria bacterium]
MMTARFPEEWGDQTARHKKLLQSKCQPHLTPPARQTLPKLGKFDGEEVSPDGNANQGKPAIFSSIKDGLTLALMRGRFWRV